MSRNVQILSAAQGLFGRHGLKKVTTDDIAREAHVSKATIYKLYRNKREILVDVVRLEMDELLDGIRQAVAMQCTTEGRLRAHLMVKIETVHHLINLHAISRESMAEHWGPARALHDSFLCEEASLLAEALNEGVEAGELEIDDVEATAQLMVVALQALEYPWSIRDSSITIEDQVELMLSLLLNGLRRRV